MHFVADTIGARGQGANEYKQDCSSRNPSGLKSTVKQKTQQGVSAGMHQFICMRKRRQAIGCRERRLDKNGQAVDDDGEPVEKENFSTWI